jgi:hypothetical protein
MIYLVVRRTWFGDGCAFLEGEHEPGGTPIASFRRKAQASALCKRLEQEAHAEIAVPFHLADDLEYLTSLAEDEFCRRLEKLGLTPPEEYEIHGYKRRDWMTWYDAIAPTLTPRQHAGIWKLLDRLQCYQVLAITLDEGEPEDEDEAEDEP